MMTKNRLKAGRNPCNPPDPRRGCMHPSKNEQGLHAASNPFCATVRNPYATPEATSMQPPPLSEGLRRCFPLKNGMFSIV